MAVRPLAMFTGQVSDGSGARARFRFAGGESVEGETKPLA
jgi:hypothetical protein